jgi:hypothetical protein
MPPTDMLTEKDVGDIIKYIESISKNYHPSAVLPATVPAASVHATGPSK